MLQRKTYYDKQSLVATEKLLGRSLPFSVEAERSVLGSLLLYNGQLDTVSEILVPDDYYMPAHKTIYEALLSIESRKQRIDIITLQDELEKTGHLASIGGVMYLLSLQEDIPSVGLLEQHARIIKEKAVLRELISSATQIITNCYSQNEKEIEAVLDEAERIIFKISQKRAQQNFIQLSIWIKQTFQHLSDIKGHAKGITGIPTGYKKLDEATSGFQNSDFIVLAARPSMGKTALALSLARYAAVSGFTVGFFSLEMSAEQLTLRLVSAESGVSHGKIRNGNVSSEEWETLTQVAGELSQLKLFIDDTATQTIADIRAKARKLKMEHNLQFLVIDYLQLLHGTRKYENRHQEVSEISRSLKALAKELNIPVVALSQLSRAVDSRTDKRPMLSDLRESGAIEQDADVIMFLYRDIVYRPDTENPALAELIIGKQRNGPTGMVQLHFQNDLTLFRDVIEEGG
ncbi:replicative DNA helicase [Candidatus Dependentiae bacterium]|nr:replicative DNA helicase [Candidatus Dependentiae bacterium]